MSTDEAWHFLPETVEFLRQLRENNEKAWFEANRERYQRLMKYPGEVFAELLGDSLAALSGGPIKPKVFRVHRDD